MEYKEFEHLISCVRLAKYRNACANNPDRTMRLYRANIRLSQSFLAVISLFEIVLRNKIDWHYKTAKGQTEWLLASALPNGFLTSPDCKKSKDKILESYNKLGASYTHDKLIAQLSLGFWKYLFAGKQYKAGGNTLSAIFTKLPAQHKQTDIYAKLDRINAVRNRVAHHEPVCFDTSGEKSSEYARNHYQEIIDVLNWLNIDARELFYDIENLLEECNYIDSI